MTLQERLRERKKATKWARGLDLDYATEWEPDQLCDEAAAALDRLQARVAELEAVEPAFDALRRLAFMAATSGGTAGPDDELMLAVYEAQKVIAAIDTARKAKP